MDIRISSSILPPVDFDEQKDRKLIIRGSAYGLGNLFQPS